MKRAVAGLLAGASLASCIPSTTPPERVGTPPPRVEPASVQPPRPQPSPADPTPAAPPAPPTPEPDFAWPDAPLTPGTWLYRPSPNGRSAAHFGPSGEAFRVACSGGGTITLESASTARSMTIRTSAMMRVLRGRSQGGRIVVELPATDPLLDAMAFSRGRFAVQMAGSPPLVIPNWPELARVIEDCRG